MCCRCTAACRWPSRIRACARPRRQPPGRAGDRPRRDLPDHRAHRHRRRQRTHPEAPLRARPRHVPAGHQPISRASAEQRAGRAGRLGPGHCLRLWTPEEHRRRPSTARRRSWTPTCPAGAGAGPLGRLRPRRSALAGPAAAGRLVTRRRAAAEARRAGRRRPDHRARPRMAALPVHPRLAAMLCRAPARRRAARLRPRRLVVRARSLDRRRRAAAAGGPRARLAALAASRQVTPGAAAPASTVADSAPSNARRRSCGRLIEGRETRHDRRLPATADALLALAYPDRIAQNRGRDGRFLLAAGAGAVLPPDDALRGGPLPGRRGPGRRPAATTASAPRSPPTALTLKPCSRHRIETTERLGWDSGTRRRQRPPRDPTSAR
jgi:ATP-dependent helicase HrpB